jgi:2-oxoglutarate ferredoxin oxidoreductase subunit gamma
MTVTQRILITGFGGQGTILAGKLLCIAAMREGKHISHIPSYGAEMRGGASNCSVVVSDDEIPSPHVSRPDILICLDEISLRKFLPRLLPGGLLVYNSSLIKNTPTRADITVLPVAANDIAEKLGSTRAANMVAMGALVAAKPAIASLDSVIGALDEAVSSRNSELNALNSNALTAGFHSVNPSAA